MTILKKLLICFAFVLLHLETFSQVKLSPALKKNFHFEVGKTLITLSVKDLDAFRKKYEGKVLIHNCNANSKIITIMGLHKNLLDKLKDDPNILFIDHHEKVREEANLDHVNSNFNRITKAQFAFPAISGSNQNISIKELSFDTTDID